MDSLFVAVSDLVEIVLVELADEARKVAVFEVFGKDLFGECFVLRLRKC